MDEGFDAVREVIRVLETYDLNWWVRWWWGIIQWQPEPIAYLFMIYISLTFEIFNRCLLVLFM